MDWILFGVFIALMLAGVPLAVTLGLAGTAVILLGGLGIMSVPTNVYTGIAKYPLLAIPVFVLAGSILERSGVAASIVRFASSIVGQRRGGLATIAVLVALGRQMAAVPYLESAVLAAGAFAKFGPQ